MFTKTLTIVLSLLVLMIGLNSCEFILGKNYKRPIQFISSGGKDQNGNLCPTLPNDVVVPLNSLDPLPNAGEPAMGMDGMAKFMEEKNIGSITQLLNSLPAHYRNNFSLVEHTRGDGKSSLHFPRIVLFGPDGHFLMNVGTKPEDPKYNLLDCAELNGQTGEWEFSQFDFNHPRPVLKRNPTECKGCHGSKDPRPIWGSNMDWPGVFGDNEAPGLSGDALSPRHIKRMNEIKNGHGGSDRFDFLVWKKDEKLFSGGFRRIANNEFGVELLVSNLIIGSAVGRGAFLRIKHRYPKRYNDLRKELILLACHNRNDKILSPQQLERIKAKLGAYQVQGNDMDAILEALGLNANESFSLATLDDREAPQKNWKLGEGDLYEQVLLQVLDDLAKDDSHINDILVNTKNPIEIFECENLASNVKDVVDYKMMQLFYLQGAARYQVNQVHYPRDAERIYDMVFDPIAEELGNYLAIDI